MTYNRVLTIQDISCVGQCSLTVALPILSACGQETAILPSAVLSTHTAGFTGYTFRDLTEDIPKIEKHWEAEGIEFAALYTGYLGSAEQIAHVRHIAQNRLRAGAPFIVDPAMADNGKLYPGFDMDFVAEMASLAFAGDIILPNLTEACLIGGIEYREEYDREYIDGIIEALVAKRAEVSDRPQTIVLTGVGYTPGRTGVVVYDTENGYQYYEHEHLDPGSHGTGDVYSASFVGALLHDHSAFEAARIAADYTVRCIKATVGDKDHWYGPKFELELPWLIENL
ncbi:MAG: bifunctional hydroxymethylpyrimidine kinase/phosphomethylpyrimidine kinase [Varibaculum sp.]|nr:bifunctional hydroxymethylpyrimidine kinase/phosphomethylpyrimidine kinase [Varibaculum sp.]